MAKKLIRESLLNLHFKGFGALKRSFSCRVFKTVHFGIGEFPKAPTDDRFVKILEFFAISLGRRAPFLVIPCFHIAKGHMWAPLVSSPYRIVTNLYTINIRILSTFFQHLRFIWLSHRFQFFARPSLLDFDISLIPSKSALHADVIFHQHYLANGCGIIWCHHMGWDGMRGAAAASLFL